VIYDSVSVPVTRWMEWGLHMCVVVCGCKWMDVWVGGWGVGW
jgi:hypothetical protein